MTTLRLGTRGSSLALRQAAAVQERLSDRRTDVELVTVETEGDRVRDDLIHRLGRTGAFVRALDERIVSGDLDAAVHSMKDMPTESTPELVVAGVPERAAAGDVLLTPDGRALADLPDGAVVGTSSLRRQAQLRASRPDLQVEPLRGNVDTRVQKLLAPSLQREHERRVEAAEADETPDDDRTPEQWFEDLSELERLALGREVDTEYDAIVLAEAGLARGGLLDTVDFERLPTTSFVPAPGQGALAIVARDDETGEQIHDAIDHPRTRVETTVERTVLRELGGGCVAPIGVYALLQGEYVHTRVRVLSRDGTEEVATTRDLHVERHVAAASQLAADLREQGAADLIERAKRDAAGVEPTRDEGPAGDEKPTRDEDRP